MAKTQADRRRNYMHIKYMSDEIGVDREDRLQLARQWFNKDPASFDSLSLLSDDELDEFIFALRRYLDIRYCLLLNGDKATQDARRTLAIYQETI